MSIKLITPRLILRPWTDEDLEPFAQINSDPRVMEHFPAPLTTEESALYATWIRGHHQRHGFGLWAVEIPGVTRFAGFTGLVAEGVAMRFAPAVEVAWRLHPTFWGKGYATEGAREALRFAFESLKLPNMVSFTIPANKPSIRVMERIGMTHDPSGDFDHPGFPPDHPMRRFVLYRMARPE